MKKIILLSGALCCTAFFANAGGGCWVGQAQGGPTGNGTVVFSCDDSNVQCFEWWGSGQKPGKGDKIVVKIKGVTYEGVLMNAVNDDGTHQDNGDNHTSEVIQITTSSDTP